MAVKCTAYRDQTGNERSVEVIKGMGEAGPENSDFSQSREFPREVRFPKFVKNLATDSLALAKTSYSRSSILPLRVSIPSARGVGWR